MTSASALTDSAALLLFQNIREGLQSGRIADLNTVQTEVDAAIAELNSRRPPEEPTSINGLVGYVALLAIPPRQLMFFTQETVPRNRVTSRESHKVRGTARRLSIPGRRSQGRYHSDRRPHGSVWLAGRAAAEGECQGFSCYGRDESYCVHHTSPLHSTCTISHRPYLTSCTFPGRCCIISRRSANRHNSSP